MKLDCKVIEDLLPLYHDKVCSPESSLVVAEHLRDCGECRRLLTAMDGEIELPPEPQEEQQVLQQLSRRWKRTTRRAVLRGAALALAAALVLTGAAGVLWYHTQALPYLRLAQRMDVAAEYPHESVMEGEPDPWVFPREYTVYRDGCLFWLRLPGFLDFTGGVISVYPESLEFWQSQGLRPCVSLGVKMEGDEPYYIVSLDVQGDYYTSFLVDGDLNYIPGNTPELEEFHLPLLEEYRPEIAYAVQAAKEMWDLV